MNDQKLQSCWLHKLSRATRLAVAALERLGWKVGVVSEALLEPVSEEEVIAEVVLRCT